MSYKQNIITQKMITAGLVASLAASNYAFSAPSDISKEEFEQLKTQLLQTQTHLAELEAKLNAKPENKPYDLPPSTESVQKKREDVNSTFNYSGYFRAGIAGSNKGGPERYAPGSLGRLGNEYNGAYDLIFSERAYEKEDRWVDAIIMIDGNTGLENNGEVVGNPENTDDYFQFLDMYVRAKNFIPVLPESELWIGRHNLAGTDVQMLDFKSYRVNSGAGVGIDKIQLDNGMLDVAILREDFNLKYRDDSNTSQKDSLNTYTAHLNWHDIELSPQNHLALTAKYQFTNKTPDVKQRVQAGTYAAPKDAYVLTGILDHQYEGGGFHQYQLQYATNSIASSFGLILESHPDFGIQNDYLGKHTNGDAVRFISQGERYFLDKQYIVAHAMIMTYGQDIYNYDLQKANTDLLSYRFVVRPAYIWSEFNQTGFELGYFHQTVRESGDNYYESAYKITAFHTIKVDTSMLGSRPEFRFFTTYIDNTENGVTGHYFANHSNEQLSFGVQAEIWWR